MVRLAVGKVYGTPAFDSFQFQYGSIGSFKPAAKAPTPNQFQFQYGSIGSRYKRLKKIPLNAAFIRYKYIKSQHKSRRPPIPYFDPGFDNLSVSLV